LPCSPIQDVTINVDAELLDHAWSIAELIEAALKAAPTKPTPTPAQRRREFQVSQGDLFD
jgi:hypothetical protein